MEPRLAEIPGIAPEHVHETLRRWMLVDGYPHVCDLAASHGSHLVDGVTGREYLDFFGCFGSTPLGWNPACLTESNFAEEARLALINRPANSDLYTSEMADFVETFGKALSPKGWNHLFFVDGGALAVENAMKIAFDWKVRRNRAKGVDSDVGLQAVHFQGAFHGRSGYTLSLTNTDPAKTDYFPKFDWPRIPSPAMSFPVDEAALQAVIISEAEALVALDAAFVQHGDDIACVIIEPIQCEGGDRHFRGEFLAALQARCERFDCLFIVDEVQVGFWTTGKPWCFQNFEGVAPDLIAFGKKSQQCGVLAGPKVDLVPDNVFVTSSRINSTWGGNLVDMVRATHILREIQEQNLGANASARGQQWLKGMQEQAANSAEWMTNVRARGLVMAFDLPDGDHRGRLLSAMANESLLGLSCGDRTVRFRPHLAVTASDIEECLQRTASAVASLG